MSGIWGFIVQFLHHFELLNTNIKLIDISLDYSLRPESISRNQKEKMTEV